MDHDGSADHHQEPGDGESAGHPSADHFPGRDRPGGSRRDSEDWLEVVERMDEVELRRLVATLPAIEQAKGVLMGYYGVDSARAFAVLRRWSTVHHVKVRDLAALIVEHVDTDPPGRADATGAAGQWSPFDAIRTFLDQTGLTNHHAGQLNHDGHRSSHQA